MPNVHYTPPMPDEDANPGSGLTPDGSGTVMDNVSEGGTKEFFTFSTPDGSEYFLVIDRSRTTDNVYLLNAVTDSDLQPLVKTSPPPSGTAAPEVSEPAASQPTPASSEAPAPARPSGGDYGQFLFIGAVVIVVGGIAYYFKIHKGKKRGKKGFDAADEDFEEEFEDIDEDDEPERFSFSASADHDREDSI